MATEITAAEQAVAKDCPTRYQWHTVMLLSTSMAIAYIDRGNLSAITPVLIKNYHYTAASVGILLSIFNWAYTISLLPAGPFVDRVKARVGYPIGVFIFSLGTLLCGTTVAFAPLAVWRAWVGIGEGPMIPAGARIIAEDFPKEQRASTVATYFAGNKIGIAIGLPFCTIIFHTLGLPWVFFITGGLGLAWTVWFVLGYRASGRGIVGAARPAGGTAAWLRLLRYRTMWGIMIGQAGYLYIYYVFLSWLPAYLVLQRHMSILKSGFVGMLPFVVSFIVTIFGGWIGDRLVKAGRSVTFARKLMSCGGLFMATVFTLLGAYTPGVWLAVTYLTLAVAGFSFATGSDNAMPVDVAPPELIASAAGLQNFVGNLGGSFAPMITGILLARSGSFTLPLLVTAVVALVVGCGSFGLLVGSLDHKLGEEPKAARVSA